MISNENISKIIRLLELSRNNSNINEANSAKEKAEKTMKKYNVTYEDIFIQKTNSRYYAYSESAAGANSWSASSANNYKSPDKMDEALWERIITNIRNAPEPKEIHTRPKTKTPHIWFRVFVEGRSQIVIDSAKTNKPSSKLKQEMCIPKEDFFRMYPIHLRREKGQRVSREATETTRFQVYIYAIFHEFGR
ncbi:MAG: hypothetical protein Ta2A_18680 [Treponemataceae bacterium]|nr:MAG: hypothetical protein Ta2A_18680 [Treponemataceae bacterium]